MPYPTGDLTQDGIVDSIDLSILVSNWNTADPDSDINNDGIVDSIDLSILVGNWGETASESGTALLVVNEESLIPGNQVVKQRLEQLGYSVIIRLETAPADYDGIDLVVFGLEDNRDDWQVQHYQNPQVGMVFLDCWVSFGLGPTIGYQNGLTDLEIINQDSPLAGGLENSTHTIYDDGRWLVWSNSYNQETATVVAINPGNSGDAIVFGYEAGSEMASTYATTRHVALGFHRDARPNLTTAGWALFDTAVAWAKDSAYVAPPPPSAPTNLSATAGDTQVSLSWYSVVGADSYSVKRSSSDGGPYTTIQTGVSSTSFIDTNLTNGTTYYYVVSATNSEGESPNSNQASATPVEGSGGGGVERFLYSAADIAVFRERMSGVGPYYNFGDAGHGGSWSPGDGALALSRANAFISNPTASHFQWEVPFAVGGPWESSIGTEEAIRPLAAAWCYMTMPNHSNNSSWRSHAKAHLMWKATRSNHDFSDSSKFPIPWLTSNGSNANYAPSPIFATGYWAVRQLKIYDFLGRDAFTSSERATLDRWFYGIANWALKYIDWCIEGKNPNRLSLDMNTSHVDMQGSYTQSGQGPWPPWDGGPNISAAHVWTNRMGHIAEAAAIIANYLKFYDVQPPHSGSQPSYGWVGSVDDMLHHSTVYVAEWLHFSVHPLGHCFDYHRTGLSNNSHVGWGYAQTEILAAVNIADWFASRGDDSIWSMSTTEGHNNTAGSPNQALGISGFPAKNIRFAQWAHSQLIPNTFNRLWGGSSIPPSNAYRDVIAASIVSRRYPSDEILLSAWRRQDNGFPSYVQTVEHQGIWPRRQGMGGFYIGLIETAGY